MVVLRVTEPRIPCYKLGIRMGDARFPARFADAARPGTYLAITEEGELGAGDRIEVLQRPRHRLSIGAVERAYHGNWELLARLVEVEELSESWRAWARKRLAAQAHAAQSAWTPLRA
jgi:MOSC domain-containing protein YiiM